MRNRPGAQLPYRIAMQCGLGGNRSVDEMMRNMPADEWRYWLAMDMLHPIGDLGGEDYQRALALANFHNVHRKRGTRERKADEFRLRRALPTMQKQSAEEIGAALRRLVRVKKK